MGSWEVTVGQLLIMLALVFVVLGMLVIGKLLFDDRPKKPKKT
jgi:hypothetical protein